MSTRATSSDLRPAKRTKKYRPRQIRIYAPRESFVHVMFNHNDFVTIR